MIPRRLLTLRNAHAEDGRELTPDEMVSEYRRQWGDGWYAWLAQADRGIPFTPMSDRDHAQINLYRTLQEFGSDVQPGDITPQQMPDGSWAATYWQSDHAAS